MLLKQQKPYNKHLFTFIKKVFMKLKSIVALFITSVVAFGSMTVQAQGSGQVLGVVNGGKIYVKQLDDAVKNAVASGATDSPELRKSIADELVVREAILQDLKKTGLATNSENDFKVKFAQQNVLIDLWFGEYFKKNPISEQDIKAEYDREVTLSKDPKNANEYKISQLVVGNEKDAQEIINKLNLGSSFDSLSQGSGVRGGKTDWVLPGLLGPQVGEVVIGLSKGGVAAKPIQTQVGWVVVRVDDIRKFRMPSFDESKNAIAQGMIQQRKQAAVGELMKKVTVTPGK